MTSDGTGVTLQFTDSADIAQECARLTKEAERLAQLVASQERKLANEQFTAKAPAAVVERERQKLASWREQHEVLAKKRELLGCG